MKSMENSLKDKVAIVTGGTRGIGKAITETFLEAGAEVLVCARTLPETDIVVSDRKAHFINCDVRNSEDIKEVVELCQSEYGKLDILVNNAGGAPPADSASASEKFTKSIVDLNLIAPIIFSQVAGNLMRASSDSAVIINISSVSGMRPNPFGVAYGAAKAGIINATQTLALEWGPEIRVVSISAGLVLTEESRSFYGDDSTVEKIAETIPLGRMGSPQDVADACLFVASHKAGWLSGSNIVLHGGGERPNYLDAINHLGSSEP